MIKKQQQCFFKFEIRKAAERETRKIFRRKNDRTLRMGFFSRATQPKRFLALSLGICCFAGSLFYYSSKIKPEITHPDETFRTRMAVYFKLLFIDQDFSNLLWKRREVNIAPPGSAYIAGLALWLGGQGDRIGAVGIDNWWNFKESFAWNLSNIELPSGKEINILKFTMTIFVSLTCLIVYWICLKCFSIVAAFCSSLLFIFHPLMLECATKATFDAPLVFFIALHILLTVFFYEKFSKRQYLRSLFFAVMIGLNAAITSVVKIQGAITGVIFMTFCFCIVTVEVVKLFRRGVGRNQAKASCIKKIQIVFLSGILFISAFVVFFILPNPCLHGRPMDRLKRMAELRAEQIKIQRKEFTTENYFHREYRTIVFDSFSKKIKHMASRMFSGEKGRGLFYWTKILFFIVGFFSVFCTEIKYFHQKLFFSSKSIVLLWFAVLFGAVAAILYIDFATHFFTLVAPVSIFVACGLDRMLRIGCRFFTQRIPR